MAGGMGRVITQLASMSSSTRGISRVFSSFFPTLKTLKGKLAEVFTNGKTKAAEMFASAKAKFKEHMENLWEGFEDRFPNLAGFLVNVKEAFSSVKERIKEFFGSLGERWDNFKEMVTTFSISEWLGNRKDDFFAWIGSIKTRLFEAISNIGARFQQMVNDLPDLPTLGEVGSGAKSWLSKKTGIGDGVGRWAAGGIARGPRSGYPAILHGTEAVIPLSGGRSVPVEMKGGGGQVFNIKIDVSGVVDRTDKRALAREIGNLIQSEMARSMGGQTRRGRRV